MALVLSSSGPAFADLRRHPRLDEAIRHTARGALDLARTGGRLGRLYQDHGSQTVMTMAVTQHFSDEGLTVERFKEICLEAGLSSPGRTGRLAAQLLDRGGLAPAAGARDRRLRRLAPTAALLSFIADRIRLDLQAGAMVSDEIADLLPRFDAPGFAPFFNRAMGEAMRRLGTGVGDLSPEMDLFAYRNGGLFLLIDVLERAALAPGAAVKVSVSGWAARLGVSRVHVRKLLQDADAAGIVGWRPRSHEVTPSAGLLDAVRDFFAFIYAALGQVLATAARAQDAAEGRCHP